MIQRTALSRTRISCVPLARGTYREVFVDGGVCVKALLPYRERRCAPGAVVLYPMREYISAKFGIDDLNRFEFENYRRFFSDSDERVRGRFARILDVKDERSYMELVRDFNGRASRSLRDHGTVRSSTFWDAMREMRQFILARRIPLFDLNEANILVQIADEHSQVPVFIDYKHVGPQLFPYQFWLRTRLGARMKVERYFNRFFERCAPKGRPLRMD